MMSPAPHMVWCDEGWIWGRHRLGQNGSDGDQEKSAMLCSGCILSFLLRNAISVS
jgi:hypothetical protein